MLATALIVVVSVPTVQASPSLTVRQRLVRCLDAVNNVYIGPVRSGTLQVPILSRKIRQVRDRCDGDSRVLGTKAGKALFDLSLGVSLYQQYLIGVAFERARLSELREAQRWIKRGRAEAGAVLG